MNGAPIHLLDWGIGGLGSYLELRRRIPDANIVYISDAGYPPYGKVPHSTLLARLQSIREQFAPQTLLIACNAASAGAILAVTSLAAEQACILDDAVASLKAAARVGSSALLAGSGTISSGIIQEALGPLVAETQLRPAQPLSALVEAGHLQGRETEESVRKILRGLEDVKSIVLACTHYPALLPVFRKLRADVDWIDPAPLFIQRAIDSFSLREREGREATTFLTSGDPDEMRTAAKRAFGVTIKAIQQFSST